MVFLESAYFGDEKSFRNITSAIASKISGGVLDVTADEKLIPVFEVVEKTELTNQDERVIREEAVKQCSEADQACLDSTMSKLRQQKLKEKEKETSNPATTIKGRRLTVVVRDENNKRKTLVVPDGQKFKLDGITSTDPSKTGFQLPSSSDIEKKAWIIVGIILAAFVYVFGIAAVYTVFMRQYEGTGKDYFRMVAYGTAALSVILPYSGYFIIFGWFAVQSFIATYTKQ